MNHSCAKDFRDVSVFNEAVTDDCVDDRLDVAFIELGVCPMKAGIFCVVDFAAVRHDGCFVLGDGCHCSVLVVGRSLMDD